MIHRFLIFDRKFNCRIDRRYPLNQFFEFNSTNSANLAKQPVAPKLKVSNDDTGTISNAIIPNESQNKASWNTLMIKSSTENEVDRISQLKSSGSLVSELGRLELDEQMVNCTSNSDALPEHSQQLILGMTHSLKNILQKISPLNSQPQQQQQQVHSGLEGYSFSFKTSKYRLFYFESFTGWKLVMIADCNTANNSNSTITPDSVLKSFYTQILLKFLSAYPLGTIYTAEKSTESRKVIVKNDMLNRPGFLSKMDEFIHNIDRFF